MDYQFDVSTGISLIILLIAVYQTIIAIQQYQLQKRQVEAMNTKAKGKKPIPLVPWWRSVALPILTLILAASCWIPYYLDVATMEPMVLKSAMVGWGGLIGPNTTSISVDGRQLQKYASGYSVAAVTYFYFGNVSINDTDSLQKSGLYEISAETIRLSIPLDAHFMELLAKDPIPQANYRLLLIPKKVNTDQFKTLREAMNLGVKVSPNQGGPL